jgi:hypothetical protein
MRMRPAPAGVIGINVDVFDACAWFGHHICDCVTPFFIMGRFFVSSRILGGSIDFDQYETRGIILLLDDIESGDTGLYYAVVSIFGGGDLESLDFIGLNVGEYVDY